MGCDLTPPSPVEGEAGALPLPAAPAVLTGEDGTVLRVTEQAAALFRRPAAELTGRSLAELAVRHGPVLRLRGPGTPAVRYLSWPHEQDPRCRVTVLVDVSDGADGAIGAGAGAAPDGPAGAESVVRVGGSSLQEVQRAARIGTWEWEPEADSVRMSAVARELLGMSGDQRLPLSAYLDATLPEDRELARDSLVPLAEQPDPLPVEFQARVLRRDGGLRTVALQASRRVRDDGTPVVVGTVQDVPDPTALRARDGYDDVTGLPDERAASEVLCQLLRGPHQDRVAVLSCVPDEIARVEHALGFRAADELRTVLAGRLREGLPDACTVARGPGASTFTVLCPDVDAAGGLDSVAATVAGLLRTRAVVAGHVVEMTASIGISRPGQGASTVEDLLRFAAVAVDEAQRRGQDQVVVADLALITAADRQLPLEQQLRRGLDGDELALHYQPIVAADGTVRRAEALLRWQHPEYGLIGPGHFLDTARRAGLLLELDRWVLRTALREVADWPPLHGRELPISINLAGFVPGDADFVEAVTAAVAESGIAWNRVVLELVETDLVDLRPGKRSAMQQVVEQGAKFAIDDFGTGYSSLARLRDLPAQIIKLDRRFVTDIAADRTDHAIAEAVCTMAHAMGRICTAEGVETREQLRELADLGVDHFQGFLFSPAIPQERFRAVLADGGRFAPG